ncbi:TadE/TadG family type IV pilus assembly protein [Arthrobacter celericrescens]|uniref:TadE/TadG family type IV pilus assembly protein n=1 Tax=Arthrobacter celericrescens TaxID=2320851 RepID=UPI000EA3109F|nr:TadE/TadG family type IV pilus assembly protein [Arthrobacter celericrescens]
MLPDTRTGAQHPRARADERGSAVVDFVLVGTLLTFLFLAIIQLTLVLHVRNTLIDAASSGARYGTLADRTPEDARQRTAELIGTALNPGYAQDISTSEADVRGIRTLEVSVKAPLPVVGLFGVPVSVLEVKGHAALPG